MKNLLACLAILAAFNVAAQVDGPEYPYNPDIEPDGYIGINDLLALLPIFGQEFEVVTVDNDTSSALVFTGSMRYMQCRHSCKSLGREWSLIDEDDAAVFLDTLLSEEVVESNAYAWMAAGGTQSSGSRSTLRVAVSSESQLQFVGSTSAGNSYVENECWCTAKVRPPIEYQILFESAAPLENMVNDAIQEGWLPLGGIGGHGFPLQAMWRYVE